MRHYVVLHAFDCTCSVFSLRLWLRFLIELTPTTATHLLCSCLPRGYIKLVFLLHFGYTPSMILQRGWLHAFNDPTLLHGYIFSMILHKRWLHTAYVLTSDGATLLK
jgi:hypothetical protein